MKKIHYREKHDFAISLKCWWVTFLCYRHWIFSSYRQYFLRVLLCVTNIASSIVKSLKFKFSMNFHNYIFFTSPITFAHKNSKSTREFDKLQMFSFLLFFVLSSKTFLNTPARFFFLFFLLHFGNLSTIPAVVVSSRPCNEKILMNIHPARNKVERESHKENQH